jgi:hypothetical protein
LGLKQKQIEPFAKQHLFNNSLVKKQNQEQKQTNAPLGPRHLQCTEQFGQLRLASDFTCSIGMGAKGWGAEPKENLIVAYFSYFCLGNIYTENYL